MNKLAMALAGTALAVSSVAVQAADIEAGKAKAVTCVGCHGPVGISMIPMFPNLAGQKAPYLEKQMKAFRDGSRKDASMEGQSKGLSDADIANLSAYFASLK